MRNIATILLIFLSWITVAQEGQFSQYYATSIYLNPAFAGTVPVISFNANYKKTPELLDNAYNELAQFTFIAPITKTTSTSVQTAGIGLTFFQERQGAGGVYRTQKALLSGAYSLKLNPLKSQYLVFGLQGGYIQNDVEVSTLQWGSQYSPYFGYDANGPGEAVDQRLSGYPIFNFGVLVASYRNDNYNFRGRSFIFGISFDNLNKPAISRHSRLNLQRPILLKTHGMMEFRLASRTFIHPSYVVMARAGSMQMNAGFYLSKLVSGVYSRQSVMVQVGSWYRVNDSFIGLIGIQVDHLRIGISMDLNGERYSDLVEQPLLVDPSYEVSVTYNLKVAQSTPRISNPLF